MSRPQQYLIGNMSQLIAYKHWIIKICKVTCLVKGKNWETLNCSEQLYFYRSPSSLIISFGIGPEILVDPWDWFTVAKCFWMKPVKLSSTWWFLLCKTGITVYWGHFLPHHSVFSFPLRLCILHAPSSTRATRLSVRPSGPRAWGGRPQDGEAGPQGGPLVPTHRGGVLLIGHNAWPAIQLEMRRLQKGGGGGGDGRRARRNDKWGDGWEGEGGRGEGRRGGGGGSTVVTSCIWPGNSGSELNATLLMSWFPAWSVCLDWTRPLGDRQGAWWLFCGATFSIACSHTQP